MTGNEIVDAAPDLARARIGKSVEAREIARATWVLHDRVVRAIEKNGRELDWTISVCFEQSSGGDVVGVVDLATHRQDQRPEMPPAGEIFDQIDGDGATRIVSPFRCEWRVRGKERPARGTTHEIRAAR